MKGKNLLFCCLISLLIISTSAILPSSTVVSAPLAMQVWNWHDLDTIRANPGGSFLLMDDLDYSTPGYGELASEDANQLKGWQPIGTTGSPFTGRFDGQGYEIRDLFIQRPEQDHVGLFGYVDEKGVIENVGVANVHVSGRKAVGGLVGSNADGTVRHSYSTGIVIGESWYVGGLVGRNMKGTVSDSYSACSATGHESVGGLVGENALGIISDSYSTGSVDGHQRLGGLVGSNRDATIRRSYSTGSVTGVYRAVGGLVGWNEGIVSQAYSIGSMTGRMSVGGFVGWNGGMVRDSYATGTATRWFGSNSDFGGFVGTNHQGKIVDCYSTGSVHYEGTDDPTDKGFGGRVVSGRDYEMTGNFWDARTSGQESTSGDATAVSTEEMMDISTLLSAGWFITEVGAGENNPTYTWNIVCSQIYPFLSWAVWDLAISSTGGGSVIRPGEGEFAYVRESAINLEAEAEEGYRFANWTGDVEAITDVHAAATTITMSSQYSVAASFILQHDLRLGSTAGGRVATPGEGTFTYDEAAVVALLAEPEEGRRFARWTGDVDAVSDVNAASTTITMYSDYTVVADFSRPIRWSLIVVGIIAVTAAVLLAVLLPRRRRVAQSKTE